MNKINHFIDGLKSQKLSIDELYSQFQIELERRDLETESFKVIVDMVPNTISWINKDLTYFGANKALADVCGLTPDQFIGRPIGFHTKERFFFEFATDLFRNKQDTLYRELEEKISGIDRTFLVIGTKINNQEQAVITGIDITELRNLEEHLSLTEKLSTLGEMFAGIIHDINNPLMMIEASVKNIRKISDNEEILSILNKIEKSSFKVSKIVNGIKVFIRNDESIPYQSENLGIILDDAIVICESKLKDHNVKLQYDLKIKDIVINCNFTQIFQVFVNLISNSIDAISNLEEKWIEIVMNEKLSDKNFNIISFTDSGLGIPDAVADKIFQAFYTTKKLGVGSGLGLSLCSKIMDVHGGKILIDRTSKNTTFNIYLPRSHDK